MKEGTLLRLQKVIADSGVTSRRKAEELIEQGRVKVNGVVVTTLGTKIDPVNDTVEVDGNMIDRLSIQKVYLILNKPRGVMTTLNDPEKRKTVMDIIAGIDMRLFPVGRLDYNSEGLLIMTNDGDLANIIMHPKFEINKVYEVKVFGRVTETMIEKLRAGIRDKDGLLKPTSVRVLEELQNKTWLEFRLCDGKNREIRRLCEVCGLTVDKLRRVAIENLSIDHIPIGKFKVISKKELLSKLNINENGSRRAPFSYRSEKRSVKLKGKSPKRSSDYASDKKFIKFRKKHYKATIEHFKNRSESSEEND